MLLESAAKELADALGTANVYAEISMEQPLGQTRKEVVESSDGDQTAPAATDQVSESDQSEEARA